MKTLFNQIFDYNFYCNKKIIDQCSSAEKLSEKSITLFSHILNAHHIWNARLLENMPKFDAWQVHKMSAWGDIHYENQRSSFEIITNIGDFEKRIDYENTEGRLFTNTVQDMLFHIINHSTQHRGQLLTELKNCNLEPLILDYTFYKR